jgi:hypothetical protein
MTTEMEQFCEDCGKPIQRHWMPTPTFTHIKQNDKGEVWFDSETDHYTVYYYSKKASAPRIFCDISGTKDRRLP